jgi:hypothetical protein
MALYICATNEERLLVRQITGFLIPSKYSVFHRACFFCFQKLFEDKAACRSSRSVVQKHSPSCKERMGNMCAMMGGVGVLLVNEFSHPKDSVKEKYFRET